MHLRSYTGKRFCMVLVVLFFLVFGLTPVTLGSSHMTVPTETGVSDLMSPSAQMGQLQNDPPQSVTESVYNDVRITDLPVQLANGLSVRSLGQVPAIFTAKQLVWSSTLFPRNHTGSSGEPLVSFTQTAEGDLYLFYMELVADVKDVKHVQNQAAIVGVHPNGNVFVEKRWDDGYRLARFVTTNRLELATLQQAGSKWDVETLEMDRNGQITTLNHSIQPVPTGYRDPWMDLPIAASQPDPSLQIGMPVTSVEQAKQLLKQILAAEGLQATSIGYQNSDAFGDYHFVVWYKNFPHNIRTVTHDGYVPEDEDSGDLPVSDSITSSGSP
jgi:hypothetical protein